MDPEKGLHLRAPGTQRPALIWKWSHSGQWQGAVRESVHPTGTCWVRGHQGHPAPLSILCPPPSSPLLWGPRGGVHGDLWGHAAERETSGDAAGGCVLLVGEGGNGWGVVIGGPCRQGGGRKRSWGWREGREGPGEPKQAGDLSKFLSLELCGPCWVTHSSEPPAAVWRGAQGGPERAPAAKR